MKKVIYLSIMFLMISLTISAQAAGGQITRKKANTTTTTAAPKKTTPAPKKTTAAAKTHSSGKTRSNEVRKEQSGSNYTPPTIQTEPRSNLVGKYHLVIENYSVGANAKAQGSCNRMKERGYSSFIYKPKVGLYKVIVASSFSVSDIIRLRNDLRNEYPNSWILYIDDANDYSYTSNGLGFIPGGGK